MWVQKQNNDYSVHAKKVNMYFSNLTEIESMFAILKDILEKKLHKTGIGIVPLYIT